MWFLTRASENHQALCSGGVVGPLVQLLRGGPDSDVAESAAPAARNLAHSPQGVLALLNAPRCMPLLAGLLRAGPGRSSTEDAAARRPSFPHAQPVKRE